MPGLRVQVSAEDIRFLRWLMEQICNNVMGNWLDARVRSFEIEMLYEEGGGGSA